MMIQNSAPGLSRWCSGLYSAACIACTAV